MSLRLNLVFTTEILSHSCLDYNQEVCLMAFVLPFICSDHCFVDIVCLKLYIYSFFLHDIFIEYRVVDLILIMVIGDLFQGIISFSKKGVLF